MATPLARHPESGGESHMAAQAGAAKYLLPTARRDIAAQAAAAVGLLTGLWVAISPLFITLQHGGANANVADVITGLAVAGVGVLALISPRGLAGLQFTSLVLGIWVLISSFILDARVAIAAPMYWSNTFSGAVLVLLALAGLATVRQAAR